jgi:hypothetical protein
MGSSLNTWRSHTILVKIGHFVGNLRHTQHERNRMNYFRTKTIFFLCTSGLTDGLRNIFHILFLCHTTVRWLNRYHKLSDILNVVHKPSFLLVKQASLSMPNFICVLIVVVTFIYSIHRVITQQNISFNILLINSTMEQIHYNRYDQDGCFQKTN